MASSFLRSGTPTGDAAQRGRHDDRAGRRVPMWDITTSTVIGALDGLSMRGEVRADNIANSQTPGFRARHVDFESSLADALSRGTPERSNPSIGAAPTVIDGQGNSVDMETELVGAMRDGLLNQTMVAAFNFKAGQMRAAVTGQR